MSLILGVGFGVPCLLGIWHFAQTGEVWMFMGFPTFGEGPLDRLGVPTSVGLLAGFAVICTAEVAVGALLWGGDPHAPIASFVLLPFELFFWIGFALPFGPLLGLARTAVLLVEAAGWRGPVRPPPGANR